MYRFHNFKDYFLCTGRLSRHVDDPMVQEDSDVAIERQRIATTPVDTLCTLDMLVMTELSKYYGNLLAVQR